MLSRLDGAPRVERRSGERPVLPRQVTPAASAALTLIIISATACAIMLFVPGRSTVSPTSWVCPVLDVIMPRLL